MKNTLRFERKFVYLIKNVLGVESEIVSTKKNIFNVKLCTQFSLGNILKS